MTIRNILASAVGKTTTVRGWVKHVRKSKKVAFCVLTDGVAGTDQDLQVVLNPNDLPSNLTPGSAVQVTGDLVLSPAKGQKYELAAKTIEVVGSSEPLPFKVGGTWDIRSHQHLRAKTPSFAALLRIRHVLARGLHEHFHNNDYVQIDVPSITANDCEGAGDAFRVERDGTLHNHHVLSNSNDGQQRNVLSTKVDNGGHRDSEESKGFFDRRAFLTVSGQLHLEAAASGLSKVYSLTRAFRAERSLTRRHLAEFTMVEAEIAFMDRLEDLIETTQSTVQAMARSLLSSPCISDVELVLKHYVREPQSKIQQLEAMASSETCFKTVTYDEAIAILTSPEVAPNLKTAPSRDTGLSKEHEDYLLHHVGKNQCPIFVILYPSALKPFYMRRNNNQYAECFDLLVPLAGELAGGSVREYDFQKLNERLTLLNVPMERMIEKERRHVECDNDLLVPQKSSEKERQECLQAASDLLVPRSGHGLDWYLDLRKYGHSRTSGYGIGYERFLQYALGINSLRDTVPFPRWYKHCYM